MSGRGIALAIAVSTCFLVGGCGRRGGDPAVVLLGGNYRMIVGDSVSPYAFINRVGSSGFSEATLVPPHSIRSASPNALVVAYALAGKYIIGEIGSSVAARRSWFFIVDTESSVVEIVDTLAELRAAMVRKGESEVVTLKSVF